MDEMEGKDSKQQIIQGLEKENKELKDKVLELSTILKGIDEQYLTVIEENESLKDELKTLHEEQTQIIDEANGIYEDYKTLVQEYRKINEKYKKELEQAVKTAKRSFFKK